MSYKNCVKMLHIADLHLGKIFSYENLINQDPSERREELWETLENTFEYSVKNEVEILLIAGDVYENESFTIFDMDRLARLFQKYSSVKIFISLGNHDYLSSKSEYLKNIAPPNCHIFSNNLEFVEIENKIRIYGFSWDRLYYNKRPFEFSMPDRDYINILLLHCMIGKENEYLPIDYEELKNLRFDYCALGHIHKNMEISDSIRYSGALEPTKFKDEGEHGGNLISIDQSGLQVRFENFAKRRYIEKDILLENISNKEEMNAFFEKEIKEFKKDDYLKLNLMGDVDSSLAEEIKRKLLIEFKHLKIFDNLRKYKSKREIYDKNKNNIFGYFMDYVNENYPEKERDDLINILIKANFGENFENKSN